MRTKLQVFRDDGILLLEIIGMPNSLWKAYPGEELHDSGSKLIESISVKCTYKTEYET